MEAGSGTPGNRRRSPRLSGRPQRQQRQELSQSLLVRKVALAIASDVPLGQHQQYTTNLKRTYCKSVGLDYLQNRSLINYWLQKAVSEGLESDTKQSMVKVIVSPAGTKKFAPRSPRTRAAVAKLLRTEAGSAAAEAEEQAFERRESLRDSAMTVEAAPQDGAACATTLATLASAATPDLDSPQSCLLNKAAVQFATKVYADKEAQHMSARQKKDLA